MDISKEFGDIVVRSLKKEGGNRDRHKFTSFLPMRNGEAISIGSSAMRISKNLYNGGKQYYYYQNEGSYLCSGCVSEDENYLFIGTSLGSILVFNVKDDAGKTQPTSFSVRDDDHKIAFRILSISHNELVVVLNDKKSHANCAVVKKVTFDVKSDPKFEKPITESFEFESTGRIECLVVNTLNRRQILVGGRGKEGCPRVHLLDCESLSSIGGYFKSTNPSDEVRMLFTTIGRSGNPVLAASFDSSDEKNNHIWICRLDNECSMREERELEKIQCLENPCGPVQLLRWLHVLINTTGDLQLFSTKYDIGNRDLLSHHTDPKRKERKVFKPFYLADEPRSRRSYPQICLGVDGDGKSCLYFSNGSNCLFQRRLGKRLKWLINLESKMVSYDTKTPKVNKQQFQTERNQETFYRPHFRNLFEQEIQEENEGEDDIDEEEEEKKKNIRDDETENEGFSVVIVSGLHLKFSRTNGDGGDELENESNGGVGGIQELLDLCNMMIMDGRSRVLVLNGDVVDLGSLKFQKDNVDQNGPKQEENTTKNILRQKMEAFQRVGFLRIFYVRGRCDDRITSDDVHDIFGKKTIVCDALRIGDLWIEYGHRFDVSRSKNTKTGSRKHQNLHESFHDNIIVRKDINVVVFGNHREPFMKKIEYEHARKPKNVKKQFVCFNTGDWRRSKENEDLGPLSFCFLNFDTKMSCDHGIIYECLRSGKIVGEFMVYPKTSEKSKRLRTDSNTNVFTRLGEGIARVFSGGEIEETQNTTIQEMKENREKVMNALEVDTSKKKNFEPFKFVRYCGSKIYSYYNETMVIGIRKDEAFLSAPKDLKTEWKKQDDWYLPYEEFFRMKENDGLDVVFEDDAPMGVAKGKKFADELFYPRRRGKKDDDGL